MRARNCATWERQVFVRKASNQKTEHQQRAAQRDYGRIAKLQPAGALPFDLRRSGECVEAVLPYRRIVIESLDAEQTSVGGLGHLPQCGKVLDAPADIKIARIIHRGFGAKARPCLKYCLIVDDL